MVLAAEWHCWQYCSKHSYICRTHTGSEHRGRLSPSDLEDTEHFRGSLIKEEEFAGRYSQNILSVHLEYSHPVIPAVMSEVETGYTHAQVPVSGHRTLCSLYVSLWQPCVNVPLLVKQSHLQLPRLNEHKTLHKPRNYTCPQKILFAYSNTERLLQMPPCDRSGFQRWLKRS